MKKIGIVLYENKLAQIIIQISSGLGLLASFIGAASAQQITLVSNQKSKHVILISENAEEVELYAASELQKYLAQMTGSRLPIVNQANGKPFIAIGNHDKLAWQIEYLAVSLTFRAAQLAGEKAQVDAPHREIQQLVRAYANDGTTLERGYGYHLAQEPD